MSIFFKILAVLSVIGGFILAFDDSLQALNFSGYFVAGGLLQGVIFYSISTIFDKLANHKELHDNNTFEFERIRKLIAVMPKKTCNSCGGQYSMDYSSCPQCGR